MKTIISMILITVFSASALAANYTMYITNVFEPGKNTPVEITKGNHPYTGVYSREANVMSEAASVNYKVKKSDVYEDVKVELTSKGSLVEFALDSSSDQVSVVFNKVRFTVIRNQERE